MGRASRYLKLYVDITHGMVFEKGYRNWIRNKKSLEQKSRLRKC
jgi:hypothetical protein